MSKKILNLGKGIIMAEKVNATDNTHVSEEGKRTFIEPQLKAYPSLTEVTLLSVPAVSGATFFKTFK
jgi:hypothetical protein